MYKNNNKSFKLFQCLGVGNLKHLKRASTFLQVNLETDDKISVFTLGVQSFKGTAAISPLHSNTHKNFEGHTDQNLRSLKTDQKLQNK